MNKRTFGIELEVNTKLSRQTVAEIFEENGIQAVAERYGAKTRTDVWKIQNDGSLNRGVEVVSPPLTSTEEVKKVVYVLLKVIKARVSVKTGFHLHIDCNDLNLEQIKNAYKLYNKYESSSIQSLLEKDRHNNYYCSPICWYMEDVLNARTIEEFKNCMGTRYVSVNSKSYIKYGTIELRAHKGSLDIDRIESWIEFGLKLVETAISMTTEKKLVATTKEEALEEMFEELQLSEAAQKKMKKVQKYLAKLA